MAMAASKDTQEVRSFIMVCLFRVQFTSYRDRGPRPRELPLPELLPLFPELAGGEGDDLGVEETDPRSDPPLVPVFTRSVGDA